MYGTKLKFVNISCMLPVMSKDIKAQTIDFTLLVIFPYNDLIYFLDTARALPPAHPRGVKGGFLYQLLRPEFVRMNPVPLCPDSFSGFRLENKDIHNQEIVDVT